MQVSVHTRVMQVCMYERCGVRVHVKHRHVNTRLLSHTKQTYLSSILNSKFMEW